MMIKSWIEVQWDLFCDDVGNDLGKPFWHRFSQEADKQLF